MHTIENIRKQQPSVFANLVEGICKCGTDNLSHFGNGYVKEGGYSLQQIPEELAALTLVLRGERYLEIGSASGGTARWLYENLGFRVMCSVDDGGHHRYPELESNFLDLPMRHVKLDSHTDEARKQLRDWAAMPGVGAFDVVFIDGDHSEEGVWMDVELTRPFWAPAAFIILHDTVTCDGVKAAWDRGEQEGYWMKFAEFIGPPCPATGVSLGIGVGVAR